MFNVEQRILNVERFCPGWKRHPFVAFFKQQKIQRTAGLGTSIKLSYFYANQI